jgi:chromosomal replication initiator protein
MNVWDRILTRVETKVNKHTFYTWFKPTTFVADTGGALTVRVPDAVFVDWLPKHYSGVIAEATAEVNRAGVSVTFVADVPGDSPLITLGPEESAFEAVTPQVDAPPGPAAEPRYTFDTFIVGSSNQFAHAACRAVAEAPSRSYNPSFIYGGVGLGKTHLMHAVGQYVLKYNRGMKLTYISAERFMNEVINAVRYDRIIDFRERYRTVDVLLVDDVQFIAGKEGTQTEFFHTFNALYDSQANRDRSDCQPSEILPWKSGCALRFEWGLIADIQSPDLETRIAILRKESGSRGSAAGRRCRHAIAGKIKSNIRELEDHSSVWWPTRP